MTTDPSPSDPDAREWRESVRGTYLGLFEGRKVWRQFCSHCQCPILASEPYKDRADMRCDLCARRSGNVAPATMFSPERRLAE